MLLTAQVPADLRRLLFEQTLARPGSSTLILGLALQLLALLARSNRGADLDHAPISNGSTSRHGQAVARYLAELEHRFFEPTDLDHTAAELGMSRRRFTQLFRLAAGCSWSTYLTRLRIDYACQLLRDNSRSIRTIAFECGFEDLSNFSRAVRRYTGQPPHAWREEHVSQ